MPGTSACQATSRSFTRPGKLSRMNGSENKASFIQVEKKKKAIEQALCERSKKYMSEWTQTHSRMSCTMWANIKLTYRKNGSWKCNSMPQEKADKLGSYTHQKYPSKRKVNLRHISTNIHSREFTMSSHNRWETKCSSGRRKMFKDEGVGIIEGMKRVNQTSYWLHKLIIS